MTPLFSSALLRTQSDDRLAALAAGGHDRAFEAIVDRYRRPLTRHVRRFLPDGRAEDVVQATFVNAWSSMRTGTEVRELRPWLYRIATNGALNALRRAGADDRPLADIAGLSHHDDPGAEVEHRDRVRRTLNDLAELPDRQRRALVATAVDGRPHHEVAAELGLSDGAVRQLVHRARASLRAAATAVIPSPLVGTLAAASHDLTAARVAELATGAGGAGFAATGLKLGAVALSAGIIATGTPEVAKLARDERAPATGRGPGASASRGAHTASRGRPARVAATPVAQAATIAAVKPAPPRPAAPHTTTVARHQPAPPSSATVSDDHHGSRPGGSDTGSGDDRSHRAGASPAPAASEGGGSGDHEPATLTSTAVVAEDAGHDSHVASPSREGGDAAAADASPSTSGPSPAGEGHGADGPLPSDGEP